MKFQRRLALFVALVLVAAPRMAWAEIKLPSIFSDNMVLQREKPVPVWGWDDPSTEVTVVLDDDKTTATADEDGRWLVKLPAQEAGGPVSVTIKGTSEVTLKNVLIGEVWLCSGQSNMEWPVARVKNAEQEIAAADHPRLRHIKIPHVPADEPQRDVPSKGWEVCAPETVPGFTAVGYFFGRHLQKKLDVPIGLIGSNWGGTRIEPWTPPTGFKQVPALKDFADKLDEFPAVKDGKVNHQSPLALYNGMIHPLVPYAIRGAIWYQGESNNGEGMLYHQKMKALIAGWRSVWADKDMPFYYVQLAPFNYARNDKGDPTALPGIWEAQLATLEVPHTGMAVTVDIGNTSDIHPRNKQDVGKRLGLWALAKTYGHEDLVYSGPLYKSMEVVDGKIRVEFDHVDGGLVSRDGKPLTHFKIAGEDEEFVDAKAKIDGDTVLVSAEGVDKPVAVRYGWHEEAEPNLANKAGLPALPFRTDNW
ncbi:MAG: sialate O-acetylesterase [Planctomycetota bacterium]